MLPLIFLKRLSDLFEDKIRRLKQGVRRKERYPKTSSPNVTGSRRKP
ncbi:MAG: hypothetical protein ACUVRV_11075 [Cyanobacteriota bacterium]